MLFAVGMLSACGSDLDESLESLAEKPPLAAIEGRVTSTANGAAIEGAVVLVGDGTATTDAAGDFTIEELKSTSRAMLRVQADGFVDGLVITSLLKGLTTQLPIQLRPVAVADDLDVATGGVVSDPASTGQIDLPADGLVTEAGDPVTGTVSVSVTPLDLAQDLTSVQGDFTDEAGAFLEGFGALVITAEDAGNAAVDLGASVEATVRIPLSTRNTETPPASLNLYVLDESTGRWVSSGTASLAGTAPSQYYEGNVDRLGVWMVGAAIDPVVYLTGCVKREASSDRVANVRVVAEGISYSGMSSALTDSNGVFKLPIKADATVLVNGQRGNYLTNSFTAGPSGADFSMGECLSLAELSGAPRITLTWGVDPLDADSHIWAPDGSHVFYASKGTLAADPYIKLDVDDITSYGPEVVTITRLMVGTYTYAVHNFSQDFNPGLTESPVRVELRRGLDLQVFKPDLGMGESSGKDWWSVFTMTVDAHCNVTVNPIGVFDATGPTGPASSEPEYCVPQ